MPNSSWAYCCTPSHIIFSRWKEIKNDIIVAVGIKLNLKVTNYIYLIFYCDNLKEIIEKTPDNPNDFIITYISGYVRRKAIRFSTCQNCQNSLNFNSFEELSRNKILEVRSRGGLLASSNGLYDLISTSESVIVKTIEINKLNVDTFFDAISTLENVENLPLIGCIEHC